MLKELKEWRKIYYEEKNRNFTKNQNSIDFLKMELQYEGINENENNI